MGDQEIKIKDRRMFTPEGELREEYRHLEDAPEGAAGGDAASRPEPTLAPPSADPGPTAGPEKPEPDDQPVPEPPEAPSYQPGSATFLDLVGFLAEPAAIAMGDVELPGAEAAQSSEAASFYIDLLTVLHEKAASALSPQEEAVLQDLLTRLRLRYVEKFG